MGSLTGKITEFSISKTKLPSSIQNISGNWVDSIISEYASGKTSDSLKENNENEAKKN